MAFQKESDFENALIQTLSKNGWESEVLRYPTEEDLLKNWAQILYDNNNTINRLNDQPLTDTEMQQIIEQINALRTPLKLNSFILGKDISIKRDNEKDTLHFGKEITLSIFNAYEIAAGRSRYQIVQQPKFKALKKVMHDRRGDIMLLINGMPMIHIELKKSGISVSQAYNQIEKYAHEGIFSGLFSLIQVFVAMTPEETVYFANPDGNFNKSYYFHWANFNNEPINDWKKIASDLLSIPMAHQLIGFYTIADTADGVLKVMRSYQYHAVNKIWDTIQQHKWGVKQQRGGYIWHTTGSGKTMTSFKAAQLIAGINPTLKDLDPEKFIAGKRTADKVVFLMDRIELGTQSLKEYRSFANADEAVQETEDGTVLISKLKSTNPADTLIVTSIQKMSRIKEESENLKQADLEIIQSKRIVFIVDECHRSTFETFDKEHPEKKGMLETIKSTFPMAVFFGFTGTPIQKENRKLGLKKIEDEVSGTTASIFGNELHRYSIADGIRDGNVLGFDYYGISTYPDDDLRRVIALEKAKAKTEAEIFSGNDEEKKKIYNYYMRDMPMAGYRDENDQYHKGIEDYLSSVQYDSGEQGEKHRLKVVEDILKQWTRLSCGGKFHAIFATSSIPEAIEYYRLFKKMSDTLKVAALFEPTVDNNGKSSLNKEEGIIEMLEDYNQRYGVDFGMKNYAKYKKDVAARLAHKMPYERIEREPEKQVDLLIVVDQMLTGFDSKWINTLYLDKILRYESLIQAFSRTNRLFGDDKPFGTIRYYRKPYTMKRNVEEAFNLYSGNKPFGLFADKLEDNLHKICEIYTNISAVFKNANILDFTELPQNQADRGQFAKLFKELNQYLQAAKIQGFEWNQTYDFLRSDEHLLTEEEYLILALRYKELFSGDGGIDENVPYEIDTQLTQIDTGKINSDYMNSNFSKYLKLLAEDADSDELQPILDELHKSFALLSQEEQKFANMFLHDIQSGDVFPENTKTFREYVTEYLTNAKNDEIHKISQAFGLDEQKLRNIMNSSVTENNIDEFGRFEDLLNGLDLDKAKLFFELHERKSIPKFKINSKASKLIRKFILSGGFDIDADTVQG